MKPTSIISLVVAVILIIVGLVICFSAQNMARSNGEFLFAEERGDDFVKTVDISESEISKIELIVSDAEINIIGQAQSSYIEFVNFKENYYSLSATNRVLSFDEIPDVVSMLKFWENGFSFNGMRYILNFSGGQTAGLEKSVNIYLSSERLIKIFDIQGENCTVNIKNMASASDYNIVADEAIVNVEGLRNASSLKISGGEKETPAKNIQLNIASALLTNFSVNTDQLQMDADYFRCNGICKVECDSGLVDVTTIRPISEINMHLMSDSGSILVDNTPTESPYHHTTEENPENTFTVTTISADIRISVAAAQISGTTNNP